MTHTPGPWRVHSEHADRIIVNGCCAYQVREMTTDDGQPSPADVQLMAAAPDMLAALKQVWQWAEWEDAISDQLHSQVESAIAKAEGRG